MRYNEKGNLVLESHATSEISADGQLWAYDEPHESGGNVQTTMTRRQAINWMRRMPKYAKNTDQEVFDDWVYINWAYQINQSNPTDAPQPHLQHHLPDGTSDQTLLD